MGETRKRGFSIKPEGLALIEKKMDEKGYTSREKLAEAADYLSIDTVNRLLRGNKTERKTIEAVAKALDLKPTDLVEHSEWFPASSTSDQEKTATGEININWRGVCRVMLKRQRDTQRLRRQATEIGFEVNIHVPLGLVERKQQQRRSGYVELAQLYQLAQDVVAKTYKHNEFLTAVIGQSQAGKNKYIAIVGEPGAGKTTLLGAIASFIKSKTPDLPIFISLASLQGRTIEDYLLKVWLVEAMGLFNPEVVLTPVIEDELIKQFRKGGVWLLLDGVDEIGENSPVQALATIQKQLTNWVGQARVVLTCRLNVWDASVNNMLTGFDTYKTQEFTQEQADQFIQEWFVCAEKPQQGEQLRAKLKEPERKPIRDLVKHPLRLALLCQTVYLNKQGELPETKAALYERFTRYFYEWRQSLYPKDLINRDELKDELHQALGKLALAGINSGVRFRLKHSLGLQEMGAQFFKLACDLGWLNLVDREAKTDEPIYAFYHPTLQEYFAALSIDNWNYFLPLKHNNHNPKPVQDLYRIFESQWKEVILLWLGREDLLKREKEEFIKALLEFKDGCGNFYRYRAYLLSASGMTEFRDCSCADEVISQLLKYSFPYLSEEKQRWARYLDSIVEGARQVLKETNWDKLIIALVRLLQTTQDKNICRMVARNLGQIDPGNQKAIDTLIELIQTTQEPFSRILAAFNLGEIAPSNQTAIDTLVQLIQSTQDTDIRMLGASSLGRIDPGNQTAIDTLVDLIETSPDSLTSDEAAGGLWRIDPGNLTATAFINNKIQRSEDEIQRIKDKNVFLQKADGYTKNEPDNPRALNAKIQMYLTCQYDLLSKHAGDVEFITGVSLWDIDSHNETLNTEFDVKDLFFGIELIKFCGERKFEFIVRHFTVIKTAAEILCSGFERLTDTDEIDSITQYIINELQSTQDEGSRRSCVRMLRSCIQGSQFSKVITLLKDCLTKQVFENDLALFQDCHYVIWHYAQNMTYQDFYQAWQSEPSPIVQSLENQFSDITSQLQPTQKTYPIVINAQALEGETDTSAIAQALCNRIYRAAFGEDSEIPPEVSNAYQLERLIPQIKKQLQKQNLALILDKCEPNQAQTTFCRKLSDVLHTAWITEALLAPPLKGFPPEQPNLLSAIQNWINEIG